MPKVLPTIQQRRSYRSYTDQSVEKDKIKTILKAAMFAPSAMHRRRWRFVVVRDKDVIQQLAKIKPFGGHAGKAPVVIVVTSPQWKHWLEDASIVGAHIYLEATHQGLSTCWTNVQEGRTWTMGDAEQKVRELLDLPDKERVLALFPIGYPAETKKAHSDDEYEPDKITWIE
jgi:nitroreductase